MPGHLDPIHRPFTVSAESYLIENETTNTKQCYRKTILWNYSRTYMYTRVFSLWVKVTRYSDFASLLEQSVHSDSLRNFIRIEQTTNENNRTKFDWPQTNIYSTERLFVRIRIYSNMKLFAWEFIWIKTESNSFSG